MPGGCEATSNKFYAESRNLRRKIQLTPHGCCVRCREAADTTCHSGAASQATTRAQGGEARWPHSPCSAVRLFHTYMNMNTKTHWASVSRSSMIQSESSRAPGLAPGEPSIPLVVLSGGRKLSAVSRAACTETLCPISSALWFPVSASSCPCRVAALRFDTASE